jgi:hypothetical protein
MWTTTEEDRQNMRGGVNSPAAKQAQAQAQERANKRRAAWAKKQAKAEKK